MEKLVLIDGNSLLNRAFYATPVFTTRSGEPTNAIFGFCKFLFKILQDVKPEYMVVAFDLKAPTFRHKMYDGYKATRKGMPDELAAQLEPLKTLLHAMNIRICEKEGIEADDILGTLSNKFDVHSYVYTGDRDAYQLVDERTDVYYTKRGVTDLLRLNIANFKSETGLNPLQIIDLKALQGDKSDNIPGVPGVGEKTANDLLLKYSDLNGIYANIGELKGSVREKLLKDKELAYLSYKLATIDRNCDLDVKLEDCKAPVKFGAEVKRLFTDFEFRSFMTLDIFDEERATAVVKEKVYPQKIICDNIQTIIGAIEENREFAVVLEAEGAEIYCGDKQYSLSIKDDLLNANAIIYGDFIAVLSAVYSNPQNKVIAFDYKSQLHILKKLDIDAACKFDDLSVAKYLCDYTAAALNLKDLCEYCLYDYNYSAFAVNELFAEYYDKLKSENMLSLYEDIEKPLVTVLFKMEQNGVKVGMDGLETLSKQYQSLIEEYRKKIYAGCGKEFNINSPAQLAEVLYENLGITEVKKKKTGKYSTAAEVLEKLADKHAVVADILKLRMYQKLNSTYIEGFRPLIDKKSGVIHTTFHQTATSTGRLSSSNPNLQNIPIREDEGRELRKIFVAREGNVFIDADYSQIELRLLAHFSGCKELVEAYNEGVDIHAVTASQVFEVPLDEVTPKMRREAKAVNFGIIYGISDFGLSKNLNISVATAKGYIEKYFQTYSAVKDYMNANVAYAKEHGCVCTLTGRKRVIPEINSPNFNLRQFGERAAMNMPLQGSSADIIKIAMINVFNALKAEGLKTQLILQVHDELVLEAPEDEAEKAAQILKQCMENAVSLKVPLTVEVHTGKTWYDAK